MESFWNESTKEHYRRQLAEKIEVNNIQEDNNVDQSWEKVKQNIEGAALKALGTRKINMSKTCKTPWFSEEIKDKCKERPMLSINLSDRRSLLKIYKK